MNLKAWLSAARLRTLPLSISGVIVGTGLAAFHGYSNYLIFILALCTTVGFQITSNFANDYGDGVKGTDNEERLGPARAYQSGLLSSTSLKRGIVISIVINVFLVLGTVYSAFGLERLPFVFVFLLLGAASIWAAVKYTVGDSAYGYRGLGDLFVFLFFGLVSVLGSFFLYTKFLIWTIALPAAAIGFLSVGVLNLNNLRDVVSDKNAGKNTLVVKMGFVKGKQYQVILLLAAMICTLVYVILHFDSWVNLFPLFVFLPILIHLRKVIKTENPVLLDPELRKLALSTFLLSLLFYFGFNNFL